MEQVISNIRRGLTSRGHRVFVLYWSPDVTLRKGRREADSWDLYLPVQVTRYRLPRLGQIPAFLQALWRVGLILRETRPDVVNCHFAQFCCIYLALWKPIFGYRLVVTGHGTDVNGMRPYDRVAMWIVSRLADRFVTVSDELRRKVERILPVQHKTIVIPNGVDVAFWGGNGTGERLHREEAPLIVHVGSLRHVKGQDVLLEAFARVRLAIPNGRLVLVGDEIAREHRFLEMLRQQARSLGVHDAVRFTGWLKPFEVRALLGQASVFAFPSRSEGMPLALIEAMSAGVPVVASDVGGIKEVMGNSGAGLLVPPEDARALANALLALLNDPVRRMQAGAQARKRAGCFSFECSVDRYDRVLTGTPLTLE